MTTRRDGLEALNTLPQLTNRERLIIAAVVQAAGELAAGSPSKPTAGTERSPNQGPGPEPTTERFRRAPYLLTSREVEVLAAMCRGLSNKLIGTELGISERTVETHRKHLLGKLGARNAAEAMMMVWRPSNSGLGN